MSFSLNFLLLFLSFVLIKKIASTTLREGDSISLVKAEYGFNQTSYNLSLLNSDAEINDLISSRIIYISNLERDLPIFDLFSEYFNRKWIFFVKEKKQIDLLLSKDDYKKKEISINGIIIPNDIKYEILEDNNKNKKVPIFEIESNSTQDFIELDIRKNRKDIYFYYKINRAISSYPEIYLLFNAVFTILLGLALYIGWRVILKLSRASNILTIHKFLGSLPFFIILSGISLLFKAINIQGKDPNRDYDDGVYVDTALITLNAIYRTLMWFIVLLVAYGWKISIQSLRGEDMKYFMKMFLIIYVCSCLDQILDTLGEGIFIFHFSEIKNLIFYFFMTYILINKIKITLNFINRKLYYAFILVPEHIESLEVKLKMIKRHRNMIFTYFFIFIIMLVIHKTVFRSYDTPVLEWFNYHLIDLYFTIYFLWIFKPRELPPNFNFDFGNNLNEDLGVVYKIKLPKFEEFVQNYKSPLSKEIANCKGKNVPVLVIGPSFIKNDNNDNKSLNSKITNETDNSKEKKSGVCKYFDHIEMGFTN